VAENLRMRSVRAIQVIETKVLEGDGSYSSPFTQVTYWHTLDGKPIGKTETPQEVACG